jgi:hypothetical protein
MLFRLPYPTRLVRCPAERTNPGKIGGKSVSSAIDGPGLPMLGLLPSVGLSGSDGCMLFRSGLSILDGAFHALGAGFELVRRRANVRGVMVVSAIGEAVTMVPAMAIGGGLGLFGRKSGWISSCSEFSSSSVRGGGGTLLAYDEVGREVGREKLTGVVGREDLGCLGDVVQPNAVAVSAVAACGGVVVMGDSGRHAPSRSVDSGLLPGMVASTGPVVGGDE